MNTVARIGLAFALFAACPAHAAVCQMKDTLDECNKKVQDGMAAAAMKEPNDAVADALAKKLTGSVVAASPESATSFADFFTTLKAAADSGSTNSDKNDEALGFEISRCLREDRADATPDERTRLQCQVRVRAGGAGLYEPIKQALPESTREARAKEIEGDLGFGDTVVAGVFFNLAGPKWGRVPRFAAPGTLFEDIWAATLAETKADDDAAAAATKAREQISDKVTDLFKSKSREFEGSEPLTELQQLDPALAAELLQAREASARAELASMDALRKNLIKNRYLDLVDLVNNQPQLNFGIEYAERSDLAGPTEWRAKLAWEYGLVNVNSAQADVDRCQSIELAKLNADGVAVTLAPLVRVNCLNAYLSNRATQTRLKGGDRFALSVEAVRRQKYSITLPTDSITISEDSTKSLIGSLAYGFYSSFDGAGEAMGRIDVKASYEDVSSDPKRRDRGTLIATYSQRAIGNTVVAISLVYATKPEFRGEVDKELSARLGLNYKWGRSGSL